MLSAGEDKTIRVWNGKTGEPIKVLKGSPGEVTGLAISPDGKLALSLSRKEGGLRLWNIHDGRQVSFFGGDSFGVSAFSFSPGGETIAAASGNGVLKFWDVGTGQETFSFKAHNGSVGSCAFSPDGRILATCCRFRLFGQPMLIPGEIKTWDVRSGKEIFVLKKHKGDVLSCAFSPNGKWILSSGKDSTLRLWDYETRRELTSLIGFTQSVYAYAFSPDSRLLALGDEKGKVFLLSLENLG